MDRKFDLLKTIIEAYIDRAEPIGSQLVVREYHFPVSSATIRNEMRDLEQEGFLEQPHTSAGRIPTEQAYQWYVRESSPTEHQKATRSGWEQQVLEAFQRPDPFEQLRTLAHAMSAHIHEAVIVAQEPHHVYWTGASRLFVQPEFADPELVYAWSQAIDRLEELWPLMMDARESGTVSVMIGRENPLCSRLSTISTTLPTDPPTMVGVLGPMRMAYGKYINLFERMQELIAQEMI
ncbi:hypothetical protein HZA86_04895 [Candidatus Uhrbacteria bacterium]|nr:hypothetical protein [Candidatus Uhrbacteria bacterium]